MSREKIFTEAEYLELLKDYDLITTKRVVLNNSYHYGFATNHNIHALDMTGEVIKELYPEYYDTFVQLVNGTETYFGNMIVTSKKWFDTYCEWLFHIFLRCRSGLSGKWRGRLSQTGVWIYFRVPAACVGARKSSEGL